MIEAIMEEFKYIDDATKQGLVFAVGIAAYYLWRKFFGAK